MPAEVLETEVALIWSQNSVDTAFVHAGKLVGDLLPVLAVVVGIAVLAAVIDVIRRLIR